MRPKKKEMAVLSVLDSAMEEPKSTGEISPELFQKMSTMPTLEAFWPFIEKLPQEGGNLSKHCECRGASIPRYEFSDGGVRTE